MLGGTFSCQRPGHQPTVIRAARMLDLASGRCSITPSSS
jgi:hypothetical protein